MALPITTGPALTSRELEVLTRIATGLSTRAIAAELIVSPHTVAVHVRHILHKLDARTRAHAVAIALANGIIPSDPRWLRPRVLPDARSAWATLQRW